MARERPPGRTKPIVSSTSERASPRQRIVAAAVASDEAIVRCDDQRRTDAAAEFARDSLFQHADHTDA
jgi:hypothetical protein